MSWTEHKNKFGYCLQYQNNDYLAIKDYIHKPVKVLSLGLVWTLIKPKELGFWIAKSDSWDFCYDIKRIHEYYKKGYQIVIYTNQTLLNNEGHLTIDGFKELIQNVDKELKIPFQVFVATQYGYYLKPIDGMWNLCNNVNNWEVNLKKSLMVGKNAGRTINSHKIPDKISYDFYFSRNIGIKFKTPEQFFQQSSKIYNFKLPISFNPRYYLQKYRDNYYDKLDKYNIHDNSTKQHIILIVGSPASGKSRVCRKYLTNYSRVNQDELKTFNKCYKCAKKYLDEGKNVVVDNTNKDAITRGKWIKLAQEYNISIDCIYIKIVKNMAIHFNKFRNLSNPKKPVPDIAIHTYFKYLQEPSFNEGFRDIITLRYDREFEDNYTEHILNRYIAGKYNANNVIKYSSESESETISNYKEDTFNKLSLEKEKKKSKHFRQIF